MLVKRSDYMNDLKIAYQTANEFFINNGYSGVCEARDLGDKWVFVGKSEKPVYGASQVCIEKNANIKDAYLIDVSHEPEFTEYNNAKIIDLSLFI